MPLRNYFNRFVPVAAITFAALSPAPRPARAQEVALASPPATARMPAWGGAVILKVPNFVAARQKVMDAAGVLGAEVTRGRTFVSEKGRRHGFVELRVTADRLPELLPTIRGVGVLSADNLATTEQASGYEDLGRRVTQLGKHQARLDALLHSRRNLRGSDILFIEERLYRADVDAASLTQQQSDMERRSHTARITVTLFEPLPVGVTPAAPTRQGVAHWFGNGKRRAEWHRDQLLARTAVGIAFALVYAPLWLPLFVLAFLAARFAWARRVFLLRVTGTAAGAIRAALTRRVTPPTPRAMSPTTAAPETPRDKSGTKGYISGVI